MATAGYEDAAINEYRVWLDYSLQVYPFQSFGVFVDRSALLWLSTYLRKKHVLIFRTLHFSSPPGSLGK
jgi:hypothetical protein